MRRWAGLLTLFLLAAVGAVILSLQFRPSELERRHATIQRGMTQDDVESIMDTGKPSRSVAVPKMASRDSRRATWYWLCPRRFGRRDIELSVTFDDNARVVQTAVMERK